LESKLACCGDGKPVTMRRMLRRCDHLARGQKDAIAVTDLAGRVRSLRVALGPVIEERELPCCLHRLSS